MSKMKLDANPLEMRKESDPFFKDSCFDLLRISYVINGPTAGAIGVTTPVDSLDALASYPELKDMLKDVLKQTMDNLDSMVEEYKEATKQLEKEGA